MFSFLILGLSISEFNAERACLIIGDAVVAAVTIYHTYSAVRASRDVGIHTPFLSALFRHGESSSLIRIAIET